MIAGYTNIELRNGEAFITGTQNKVRMLARHHLGYGWDGEELHRNFPFLSRGQVYSALAYYYEHKDEIDRAIAEGRRQAETLLADFPEPPLQTRLRAARNDL